MENTGVSITHIGREDPFIDRNYGSNLSFGPGQSRTVPADLAARLLRHGDVFELTKDGAKVEKPAKAPVDDTQAVLQASKEKQDEQNEELNQRQNLVDQINLMDKDALKDFAHTKYGQPIPKTMTVENMRAKVVGFIDQFGMV